MRRKAHNFLRKQKIEPERYVVLVLRHIAFAQPCINNLSSAPYGATFFQKKADVLRTPLSVIRLPFVTSYDKKFSRTVDGHHRHETFRVKNIASSQQLEARSDLAPEQNRYPSTVYRSSHRMINKILTHGRRSSPT